LNDIVQKSNIVIEVKIKAREQGSFVYNILLVLGTSIVTAGAMKFLDIAVKHFFELKIDSK